MKKIISMLLTVAMLLSLAIVAAVPASAAEGDWMVYVFPTHHEEKSADSESDGKTTHTKPGYEYTEEGVTMLTPDWTGKSPFGTFQTKTPVSIVDGIYMEVRIDEFAWDGADCWINFSIWDSQNIAPGSTNSKYGSGVQTLLRPKYDDIEGKYYIENVRWYIETFTDAGYASNYADVQQPNRVYADEDGKMVLEMELKVINGRLVLYVNGAEAPNSVCNYLVDHFIDGEAYVGMSMMNIKKGSSVKCTITKFGTSKATATVPTGDDRLEPITGELKEDAPIADPSTIPEGQPCLLLTADKENSPTNKISGENASTNEDFSIHGYTVNDSFLSLSVDIKRDFSYDIDDFPVMIFLTKDYCTCDDPKECIAVESCKSYIMTGENSAASQLCLTPELDMCEEPIIIEEGDKAGQYLYFYYDTSAETSAFDPEGRIHEIRLDFSNLMYQEPGRNDIDICFVAFFRNVEEAETYIMTYLGLNKEEDTTTPGIESETESVDVNTESVEITTESVEKETEDQSEKQTEKDPEKQTEKDPEKQTEKDPEKQTEKETDPPKASGGCGSFIGAGALTVVALVAICGVASFKKKEI